MSSLDFKLVEADEYPSDDSAYNYANVSAADSFTFPRNPTEFDRDPTRKIELVEDLWNNFNYGINYSNHTQTPVLHGFFKDDASHDKEVDFQALARRLQGGTELKMYLWNEASTDGGTNYKRFMCGFGELTKPILRGGQDFTKREYQVSFKCPDPFVYEDVLQVKGKWDVVESSPTDFQLTGGSDALKLFTLGSIWCEPCWAIKNNGAQPITNIIISEKSDYAANNINDFQINWTGSLPNSSNNVLYIKPRTIADWAIYQPNVWKYGTYSSTPDENGSTLYDSYDSYNQGDSALCWQIATLGGGRMPRVKAGTTSGSPQNMYIKMTSAASVDADVWAMYRYRWA